MVIHVERLVLNVYKMVVFYVDNVYSFVKIAGFGIVNNANVVAD
jgi:hypothetical protein